MIDLEAVGHDIALRLREHFPAAEEKDRQVFALAEEAGEFVKAYRRWRGMARKSGPWTDVESELADVVITAFVTADVLNVQLPRVIANKLSEIYDRGWKDER